MTIHLCDYASQPDIRICCTQAWTTPKWSTGGVTWTDNVYQADNDEYYTFRVKFTTCLECLKKAKGANND